MRFNYKLLRTMQFFIGGDITVQHAGTPSHSFFKISTELNFAMVKSASGAHLEAYLGLNLAHVTFFDRIQNSLFSQSSGIYPSEFR